LSTQQQEHLKVEQLQHASADELEHAAGRERENLEGWIPALATDAEVREALEKAFDYRGDVTITRRDGTVVEGYLYDRYNAPTLEASKVRLMPTPKPGGPAERVSISYSPVATPPQARPSTRGSSSTGKRKPPAKPTSRLPRRS
jgi:hypothetical protein